MNILTKKRFKKAVTARVVKDDISFTDAVLAVLDDQGLDPSDAKRLLDEDLTDKIYAEAKRINNVKDTQGEINL